LWHHIFYILVIIKLAVKQKIKAICQIFDVSVETKHDKKLAKEKSEELGFVLGLNLKKEIPHFNNVRALNKVR